MEATTPKNVELVNQDKVEALEERDSVEEKRKDACPVNPSRWKPDTCPVHL
jgi:hypothetical protein